ncbi:MAG: T9SS type A sorting domain-containing protein [Ignavibacteria bacterium]|nr:T9SS type A sorting domain-containing protein [Ignavibacteria bacterium]
MQVKVIKYVLLIILIVSGKIFSQSQLVNCIPDTGSQSFDYPFQLNGTGTEWTLSPYFEIYFWGGGVFADSVRAINDTVILAHIYIDAKADTGYKTVILGDAFLNFDSIPQGFKVFLWFPAKPSLLYPPNNSQNINQNTIMIWDSNKTVDSFKLQIANDSLFTSIVFDTTVAQPPVQLRMGILQLGQKYYWRVRGNNIKGVGVWSDIWNFRVRTTGIYKISQSIPQKYELLQNFPNPFNPTTIIEYKLKEKGEVKLILYDILGKETITLINQFQDAGHYQFRFNTYTYNLSSGVYFYTLIVNNYSETKRMVILK